MNRNWAQFEGRNAGGWRLDSFLGDRDDKAFFSGSEAGGSRAALIEVMESGTPEAEALLASWSLARRFAHRSLLSVHGTGTAEMEGTDGVVWAALDLPDDDLSEMVPRRPLEEREIQAMLLDTAHALEYLHNHGVVHGQVLPQNIFFSGGQYKLSVDALSVADSGKRAADVRQLGATLVWVLSGGADSPTQRPSAESIAKLELPFREVAMGCLNSGWTATQMVAFLEGRYVPPVDELPQVAEPLPAAPEEASAPRAAAGRRISSERWILAAIILAALLLVMFWLLSARGGRDPAASSSVTPAPDQTPTAGQQPSPVGTADRGAPLPQGPGPWAVAVAAYGNRAEAQERSDSIRQRWPQFRARVYPPTGTSRRYLVVLASGLNKEAAEGLRQRAAGAGVSADGYVTKLAAR